MLTFVKSNPKWVAPYTPDVIYSADFKFTEPDAIAIGLTGALKPNGTNDFEFDCDSTLGSSSTRIYLDRFKYVPDLIKSPESVIVIV